MSDLRTMSEQDRQDVRQPAYNVELHIDEIVLHGFAHRDRYAIREAIQSELTRLIADGGIPTSYERGDDVAWLDVGTVTMQRGMPPDATGIQVAQAVYRGLEQKNEQATRAVHNGRSEHS